MSLPHNTYNNSHPWCVSLFQFCEFVSVSWLTHLVGSIVRMLLDYVSHVSICPTLKRILKTRPEWDEIHDILSKTVFKRNPWCSAIGMLKNVSSHWGCMFACLQASHGLCSTCADWSSEVTWASGRWMTLKPWLLSIFLQDWRTTWPTETMTCVMTSPLCETRFIYTCDWNTNEKSTRHSWNIPQRVMYFIVFPEQMHYIMPQTNKIVLPNCLFQYYYILDCTANL